MRGGTYLLKPLPYSPRKFGLSGGGNIVARSVGSKQAPVLALATVPKNLPGPVTERSRPWKWTGLALALYIFFFYSFFFWHSGTL